MVNIERLPVNRDERRVAYERKAHQAAINIKHAANRKLAVKTFLRYLQLSI